MAITEAVSEVVDRLRARGHRITLARRAVIETLLDYDGHANVDEISAVINAKIPNVHLTTVYRTLDTLTNLGVVSHVHLGHGPPVYHLTKTGEHPGHLHARCRGCKTIIDLPADLLDDITGRLDRDWSFVLDPQHVALSGTCRRC